MIYVSLYLALSGLFYLKNPLLSRPVFVIDSVKEFKCSRTFSLASFVYRSQWTQEMQICICLCFERRQIRNANLLQVEMHVCICYTNSLLGSFACVLLIFLFLFSLIQKQSLKWIKRGLLFIMDVPGSLVGEKHSFGFLEAVRGCYLFSTWEEWIRHISLNRK